MRVAAIQVGHEGPWLRVRQEAAALVGQARHQGAVLAVLPEYFFMDGSGASPPALQVRSFFAEASHGIAIAGNVVEGGQNVGVVYDGGQSVLEQGKLHPMPREARNGIDGAQALAAGTVLGRRMAMLVCADILFPELAAMCRLQRAQVVLNPVMSPYRQGDEGIAARESLYVARAYDAQAFVVKAGGHLRGQIAGRSLVAAPWGLVARYHDDQASELVLADLDETRLEAFRAHQRSFPPRRPALYAPLVQEG